MTMAPGRCDDVPGGTKKRVGCRSVESTMGAMRSEEAEGAVRKARQAGRGRRKQAGQGRRTVGVGMGGVVTSRGCPASDHGAPLEGQRKWAGRRTLRRSCARGIEFARAGGGDDD
jgi:hypothetical protein